MGQALHETINTIHAQIGDWEEMLLAGGPDELIALGQVSEALAVLTNLKDSHPQLACEIEPLFNLLSDILHL
jgi:hypothetical protein